MTAQYTTNAAAGAALLDRERPGWENVITPHLLDINDMSRCILGQLYGHFDIGLYLLFGRYSTLLARKYGFDTIESNSDELEAEWRRLVQERH